MSIDADPLLGLLTIPEVAELLRISVPTVRRLQQQRQLPFIKVGGRIRFAQSDIALYVAKRRVRSID
jgi:excisionase family DNA binding protein